MLTKNITPEFAPCLPSNSVQTVSKWLDQPGVELRITRRRSSKLGDYRPIDRGKRHLISVNGSLNIYAFLLTLVHEIAHMNNYIAYSNGVKPHGREWKNEFKRLMAEFDLHSIFPEDILPKIASYMNDPKASSSSDLSLSLALRKYDKLSESSLLISEIQTDTVFITHNGRTFIKGPKQRKRYKCKEVRTGRLYLFNPITEVCLPS